MRAKLEKYIAAQRKDLDVETPDDDVIWGKIQRNLHAEPVSIKKLPGKVRLIRIRNIAAAAVIIFSLGYIVNDIINREDPHGVVTLSSIDSQLGLREQEYVELIRLKTEEVRSFAGSGDKVISELFEEIRTLDMIRDQALSDLGKLGSNEKVINMIFRVYEQKIRLLELIILETNKTERHENIETIHL